MAALLADQIVEPCCAPDIAPAADLAAHRFGPGIGLVECQRLWLGKGCLGTVGLYHAQGSQVVMSLEGLADGTPPVVQRSS